MLLPMIMIDEFRREIDGFLERTGMSPTQFGREALRDPGFVHQIRAGRNPTLKVVQRVTDFMNRASASPERRKAS